MYLQESGCKQIVGAAHHLFWAISGGRWSRGPLSETWWEPQGTVAGREGYVWVHCPVNPHDLGQCYPSSRWLGTWHKVDVWTEGPKGPGDGVGLRDRGVWGSGLPCWAWHLWKAAETAHHSYGGECAQVYAQCETGEHAVGEPQSLRGGGITCEYNALVFAPLNFLNFLWIS